MAQAPAFISDAEIWARIVQSCGASWGQFQRYGTPEAWNVCASQAHVDALNDGWNRYWSEQQAVTGDAVTAFQSILTDHLATTINATSDVLEAGYQTVAGQVQQQQQAIGQNLAAFEDLFVRSLERIAAQGFQQLADLGQHLNDQAVTLASNAAEIVQQAELAAQEHYLAQQQQAQSVLDSLAQRLEDSAQQQIDAATQLAEAVGKGEDAVAVAVNRLTDALMSALGTGEGPSLPSLLGTILTAATVSVSSSVDNRPHDVDQQLEGFHSIAQEAASGGKVQDTLFQGSLPQGALARWIVSTLATFLSLFSYASAAATPELEKARQWGNRGLPWQHLGLPDMVTAERRGAIAPDQVVSMAEDEGFLPVAVQVARALTEKLPPEGEVLSWWLRGIVDADTMRQILVDIGWSPLNVQRLQTAAFFIPPVQDIITMAVREAFSPDIAEKFGQFDDLPPQFVELAKKQGVSEEFARDYWAAHWALPSVQMGFDMLHRGIITADDLQVLLRAQDVMPYWRDKLIGLSYEPYTRVDVRRMYQAGVLEREQVKRAYQDEGYDEDHAENLTAWTVLAYPREGEADATLKTDITQAQALGFFKDGLITREQVKGILLSLGHSEDAAELLVLNAELDVEAARRKLLVADTVAAFKAGVLSYDAARDQLVAGGLTTTETNNALAELNRVQVQTNTLPSKGDLDRMVAKQAITVQDYMQTLKRLGYADKWIAAYLQLLNLKVPNA